MTTTVASFVLLGVGTLTGCFYLTQEYYKPMKQKHQQDQQRIQSLKEEIVRLKREMRICGIPVPRDQDSSPNN